MSQQCADSERHAFSPGVPSLDHCYCSVCGVDGADTDWRGVHRCPPPCVCEFGHDGPHMTAEECREKYGPGLLERSRARIETLLPMTMTQTQAWLAPKEEP